MAAVFHWFKRIFHLKINAHVAVFIFHFQWKTKIGPYNSGYTDASYQRGWRHIDLLRTDWYTVIVNWVGDFWTRSHCTNWLNRRSQVWTSSDQFSSCHVNEPSVATGRHGDCVVEKAIEFNACWFARSPGVQFIPCTVGRDWQVIDTE